MIKYNKLYKETKKLFGALFDINLSGVLITTLQDGRILEINDSMLSMIGFLREECLGRSVLDIGLYPKIELREKYIKCLIEQKSIKNLKISFINRAGELRYGVLSAEVIEFKNQPCILSTIVDTTSKMAIINSYEERSNKFEVLFHSISDMLFVVDYNGKIVLTNRAASETLGYTDEEFKNLHLLNIHPTQRKYDVVNVMGQVLSGETDGCQIPLLSATGDEIAVQTRLFLINWQGKHAILGISKVIRE